MNYVILDSNKDDDIRPKVYDSFDEFCEAYDIIFSQHEAWCYIYEVVNTDCLPHNCEVSWFLTEAVAALENEGNGPLLIHLSVTSRENRYQEWLDAVAGVPGHTINAIIRDMPVRTVYHCSFPTNPTL